MRKDLKKNKKGFTLVEIIVVLLIIGIMLAITIPSIMGYIGKANEAKYIANGRSGFLAAQTITAANVGKGVTKDAELAAGITKDTVAAELNDTSVTAITCSLKNTKLVGCSIQVDGLTDKWVNFNANKEATVDATATYPAKP